MPAWLAWLAGGVPLAFFVATATAYGGLFEEGALVAAAQSLGVGHSPGAPLSTLIASVFAQLPIGPLSFRVSVSAALCAAGLLAVFARALYFTLLGVGLADAKRAALLSLAAAWFLGSTPMFWMQAVRPNVFALQFLLSMVVVEALVRFELNEPTDDTRPLYFAAFVQGLAFANHHVYALWLLAAAAPTLGRVFARRGFMGLMGHVAFPILGFSAAAYLPIRASQDPAINIGDPAGLSNLYAYMTSDLAWGPSGAMSHGAFESLSLGLFGAGPWRLLVPVLLGAVPFWFALRMPSVRRFAVLWALVLAVPFLSYAFLVPPQLRVDAWGSLLPSALGLCALSTLGVGLLLEQWGRSYARLQQGLPVVLTVLSGLSFFGEQGLSLSDFSEPDAIDEVAFRTLPTRSVLLVSEPGQAFRHLGVQAEEQLRRDVVMVALPFLRAPGYADTLIEEHPELRALFSEYLIGKRLALDPLLSLSVRRPVMLELSVETAADLYGSLVADSWYPRVLAEGVSLVDARAAGAAQQAAWSQLHLTRRLDALPSGLAEGLRLRLGNVHFFHALLAASHGDLSFARASLSRAQEALPQDPRLSALERELPEKGRLAPNVLLESLSPLK